MEHNRRQRVTAMSTIVDIEIKQNNDGTLIGELSCKYFEEPFIFTDFVDMIEMMEIMFDTKGFPERQLLPRSFSKAKRRVKKNEMDLSEVAKARQGDRFTVLGEHKTVNLSPCLAKVCNFELSVKFRHKAEWQGSLLWREKGITSSFASIVELSRLINEVLINNL